MSITPFAIVTIVFVLGCFIGYRTFEKRFLAIFAYHVVLSLSVDTGYAIRISSFSFAHTGLTSLILFVMGLVYLCRFAWRKEKTVYVWGLALVGSVIVGALVYYVFPYEKPLITELAGWDKFMAGGYDKQVVTTVGMSFFVGLFALMRYVVMLMTAATLLNSKEKVLGFITTVSNFLIILIVYGIIEFIFKNLLDVDTLKVILNPMFGEKSGLNAYGDRNGIVPLQGFSSEPSYYSFNLFFAGILFLQRLRFSTWKTEKIVCVSCLACVLVLLLISMSFFSVFFVAALFLLWCVNVKGKWRYIRLAIGGGALIIAAVVALAAKLSVAEYFLERMEKLLESIKRIMKEDLNSSSENARVTSLVACLKICFERPLFGLYWDLTDCHSMLSAIFANCGVIGFVCWWMANKRLSAYFGRINVWRVGIIGAILLIAGSFGDMTNIALAICVLACNVDKGETKQYCSIKQNHLEIDTTIFKQPFLVRVEKFFLGDMQ